MQSSSCAKQRLQASEVQHSAGTMGTQSITSGPQCAPRDWPDVSTARQFLLISGFGDSSPVPLRGSECYRSFLFGDHTLSKSIIASA